MFERFTNEARAVVVRAQEESRALEHGHIGTEHLLLAMLDYTAGIAFAVLSQAGVEREQVRREVKKHLAPPLGPADAEALKTIGIDLDTVLDRIKESFGKDALRQTPPPARRGWLRRRRRTSGRIPFTPRAKKVLELSLRESIRLKHKYIGTEHILLGFIREGGGLGAQILAEKGVDLERLRTAVLTALGKAA